MSNCEKAVLKETKNFENRLARDSSLNAKGEYQKIYERLLQEHDERELAQYWKSWNSIRGSMWYHQDKNRKKNPESLSDIMLTGEYSETKTKKPFL